MQTFGREHMINQPNHTDQTNSQIDKATKIIPPLIIANIVVLVFFIFLAVDTPVWQFFASIIAAVFLLITMVFGYSLIRRERATLGIQIVLYALVFVVFLNGIWLEGLGLVFAVGLGIVVFQMTSLVLPTREMLWAMAIAVAAGIILISIDVFDFSFRLFYPQLQSVIPIITILLGLVFALLIYRSFDQYGMRGKLIITFIGVTGLATIILSVSNFLGLRNALIDSENQTLLSAASQTAVTIDDFFNNGLDTIRGEATIIGAAFDWAYYSGLTEEERVGPQGVLAEEKALNLLIAFRNRDIENINSYALLDIEGNVLFEYPRTDEKADESGRSYFRQALETGTVSASPVEFSPENGQPYFFFSAIVVDSLGRQVGVLRARYDANYLQQLISRSTGLVSGESYAVLFDENYLHLAHGSAPEAIYKLVDLPATEELAALQAANRLPNLPPEQLSTNLPELQQSLNDAETTPVFEAFDVATGNRINQAAISSLVEQPWIVAFFQPQEAFLAPVDTMIRRTVFLTLVTIFAVVGVAIALANIIARPILELEKVANQVAEGDLTVQAPVTLDNEVGALARTFNLMTAQIHDSVANLERRVAERTRVIEISAQVSRNLTTILDSEHLVQEVVTQVRSAFDYYYAQIYLWDEFQTQLVMAGGTGEAGEKMLARGHALAPGKGLVGRAAEMKLPVLIPDVAQEAGWLPNELLPLTKAETAVPILIGNNVIGVLDVQHSVVNGLAQQDVELIQAVANQFAIAYQNARNYEQQQKQAKYEAQINEIRNRIQETRNVDDALKVTIRELAQVLGASKTTVKMNIKQPENGHD